MNTQINIGEIAAELVKKKIKNLHLSVRPPHGDVRIAAPMRMSVEAIRSFALSKLSWIRQQQQKLRAQERETVREYIDRESHDVWGRRYLLQVIENNKLSHVTLEGNQLCLHIPPAASRQKKHAVMEAWYRDQIKQAALPLIAHWEPRMGVKVSQFFVQTMKTRWGSCNTKTKNIRLNTMLAKKPPVCLEYIVIHEMVHLLEASHNHRFKRLMDQFMPNWRSYRAELNRLPLADEERKQCEFTL